MRGSRSKTMTQDEKLDSVHRSSNNSVYEQRRNDERNVATNNVHAKNIVAANVAAKGGSSPNAKNPTTPKFTKQQRRIQSGSASLSSKSIEDASANKSAIGKSSLERSVPVTKRQETNHDRTTNSNNKIKNTRNSLKTRKKSTTVGNQSGGQSVDESANRKSVEMTVITQPGGNDALRDIIANTDKIIASAGDNGVINATRDPIATTVSNDIDCHFEKSINNDLQADRANSGKIPSRENTTAASVSQQPAAKDHYSEDTSKMPNSSVKSEEKIDAQPLVETFGDQQELPAAVAADEDPMARLKALRANIANALKEVKAVLEQHAPPPPGETNDDASTDEQGAVKFRFVSRNRKKSIIKFDDEEIVCNVPCETSTPPADSGLQIPNEKSTAISIETVKPNDNNTRTTNKDSVTEGHLKDDAEKLKTISTDTKAKSPECQRKLAENFPPKGNDLSKESIDESKIGKNVINFPVKNEKQTTFSKRDKLTENKVETHHDDEPKLPVNAKTLQKLIEKDAPKRKAKSSEEQPLSKVPGKGDVPKETKEFSKAKNDETKSIQATKTGTSKVISKQLTTEIKEQIDLPSKQTQKTSKLVEPKNEIKPESLPSQKSPKLQKKDAVKLEQVTGPKEAEATNKTQTSPIKTSLVGKRVEVKQQSEVILKSSQSKEPAEKPPDKSPKLEKKEEAAEVPKVPIKGAELIEKKRVQTDPIKVNLVGKHEEIKQPDATMKPSQIKESPKMDEIEDLVKKVVSQPETVKKHPEAAEITPVRKDLSTTQPQTSNIKTELLESKIPKITEPKILKDKIPPKTPTLKSIEEPKKSPDDTSKTVPTKPSQKPPLKKIPSLEEKPKLSASLRLKRASLTEPQISAVKTIKPKRASITEGDLAKLAQTTEGKALPKPPKTDRAEILPKSIVTSKPPRNDNENQPKPVSTATTATPVKPNVPTDLKLSTTQTTVLPSTTTATTTATMKATTAAATSNSKPMTETTQINNSQSTQQHSITQTAPSSMSIHDNNDAKLVEKSSKSSDLIKPLISTDVDKISIGLSDIVVAAATVAETRKGPSEMTVVKKDPANIAPSLPKSNIVLDDKLNSVEESLNQIDNKKDYQVLMKIPLVESVKSLVLHSRDGKADKLQKDSSQTEMKNLSKSPPNEIKGIDLELVDHTPGVIVKQMKSDQPKAAQIVKTDIPSKIKESIELLKDISTKLTEQPQLTDLKPESKDEQPKVSEQKAKAPIESSDLVKETIKPEVPCQKEISQIVDPLTALVTSLETKPPQIPLSISINSTEQISTIVSPASSQPETPETPTTSDSIATDDSSKPKAKKRKTKKVIIKRLKRKLSREDSTESTEDVCEKPIAQPPIDEPAAEPEPEEPAAIEEPVIPKGPKPCLIRRSFDPGDVIMYADRIRKMIKWKKGTVLEKITDISYKLELEGGEQKPAHISYIKKFTDKKVQFGGKEYLEIDYEQDNQESSEEEEPYNIWARV